MKRLVLAVLLISTISVAAPKPVHTFWIYDGVVTLNGPFKTNSTLWAQCKGFKEPGSYPLVRTCKTNDALKCQSDWIDWQLPVREHAWKGFELKLGSDDHYIAMRGHGGSGWCTLYVETAK